MLYSAESLKTVENLAGVNFSVVGLFFHRPLAPNPNLNLNQNQNQNLTAHPGDNVTLSCQAPDGVDITATEWRRTDMKNLEYVFLYRGRRIDSKKQHPSFKNRVELKDKEMKNGDLSVILKNVTKEDRGTYECRFAAAEAKRKKRSVIKLLLLLLLFVILRNPLLIILRDLKEKLYIKSADLTAMRKHRVWKWR
uniref:Ig-like domain-containing protein n=1 Tax=Myripristis murdjan TaxID=586833 RepID=A0A668ACU3_9TELE